MEEFGHWLAGFIDGEGSFIVSVATGNTRPNSVKINVAFALFVRGDDLAILESARRFVDAGAICPQRPNGYRWQIQDAAGHMKLIDILDVYKLRAKKSRDYKIWREIVLLKQKHRRGDDWQPILKLAVDLREQRRFLEHGHHPCDQP